MGNRFDQFVEPREEQPVEPRVNRFDRFIDQPQEPIGNLEGAARTIASGLTEGAAALIGAPHALWNLGQEGSARLFGADRDKMLFAPDATGYLNRKASDLTGGFTDYDPTTTVGKTTKNVLKLVPAAGAAALTGGATLPQALTYGAVLPGMAGTAARPAGTAVGRLLEMENPETAGDIAQIAAEALSPFPVTRIGPALSNIPKSPAIKDVRNQIEQLEGFMGERVTPGSIRVDPEDAKVANLKELNNPRVRETIQRQHENFSNAVLRDAGITDELARSYGFNALSPRTASDVVDKHASVIGGKISDVYDNLGMNPPPAGVIGPIPPKAGQINPMQISQMASELPGFAKFTPGMPVGKYIHNVRTAANDVIKRSPQSHLDVSHATKAKELIDYIDSKVLNEIGDANFNDLKSLNEQYSKIKTVQNALEDAKKVSPGFITPQSVMSAGGNRHTEKIMEAAKLADRYLLEYGMVPNKANRDTIVRMAINALSAGGGGISSALMFGASDIQSAVKIAAASLAGGVASQAGQSILRRAKGSDIAQDFARSRALNQTANPNVLFGANLASNVGETEGYIEREGRKSGGRVGSHEVEAGRLVMAAERAKKGLSAHTEGLLNTSDESVASALEIANRSI